MPNLKLKFQKLGFTSEEGRLAESIEGIVFIINYKVPVGAPREGVTMRMLKDELNKGINYSEELLTATIEKCITNYILTQVDAKLYSVTYYGK